mmetsp:Transcript_93883/g.181133  ORF Transcript_93883/g.181133 Transcript_93883/m.181133 type:complete len:100 (+) Transcript_93883:87-386(+)
MSPNVGRLGNSVVSAATKERSGDWFDAVPFFFLETPNQSHHMQADEGTLWSLVRQQIAVETGLKQFFSSSLRHQTNAITCRRIRKLCGLCCDKTQWRLV